jgi:uncharacterized OB-fold protein
MQEKTTQDAAKRKRVPVKGEGRIGQSICSVCGKTALPGSAIVIHFGAGGRVHKTCAKGNPVDP